MPGNEIQFTPHTVHDSSTYLEKGKNNVSK